MSANDYILISNLIKDFYKDLHALFTNLKPKDKKIVQFHVDFVIVVKLIYNTLSFGRYIHKPISDSMRIL